MKINNQFAAHCPMKIEDVKNGTVFLDNHYNGTYMKINDIIDEKIGKINAIDLHNGMPIYYDINKDIYAQIAELTTR
jgi:hypothetical protein